jgi:hypothetical protein
MAEPSAHVVVARSPDVPAGRRGIANGVPGGFQVAHAYRARILELPDAISVASPARREELCRIVVQQVVIRDRQVEAIDWTPPARPFFERQRECPQGVSGTRPLSADDSLAWYAA